jgi:hypothetical protein
MATREMSREIIAQGIVVDGVAMYKLPKALILHCRILGIIYTL